MSKNKSQHILQADFDRGFSDFLNGKCFIKYSNTSLSLKEWQRGQNAAYYYIQKRLIKRELNRNRES